MLKDAVDDLLGHPQGTSPDDLLDAIRTLVGASAPNAASHGLTAREIAICKERNCDPATFARLKAARLPFRVL